MEELKSAYQVSFLPWQGPTLSFLMMDSITRAALAYGGRRHNTLSNSIKLYRSGNFPQPKQEFNETIERFVKHLDIAPDYVNALMEYVGEAFDKQQLDVHQDAVTMDLRLVQLRNQIRINVDKIKMVSTETTIKYLEEDITKLEGEIADLTVERQTKEQQKPVDLEKMKAYVRYFLESLEEPLLHHGNQTLQAKYFGVIFNEAPTYEYIVSGTPDCSKITGVNEIFKAKKSFSGLLAGETGRHRAFLLARNK